MEHEVEVHETWPELEDANPKPVVLVESKIAPFLRKPQSYSDHTRDPFVAKVTPPHNDWHHTEPTFPLWAWVVWLAAGGLIYKGLFPG